MLSEEDEGNLMDFLRASGHDSSRERKSWGSLDRSWARRARGSTRKRPALLNADFSTDRERPSSPSPLAESKPIVSAPEEETKPKVWRQKIESWLQASEQDQMDDRRQTRRLINRRSFEMDSESERSSTLDTLPEGKQVQSSQGRVSQWKPSNTIDNTDVVSTMEAVEEAQIHVKDKSAWRKSTLNVPNTTEETKEDYPLTIHNYDNFDQRKDLITSLGERPPTDKLTLYIRKPNEERRNKVEIDQDNIETPPTIRRVITPTPTEKREPVAPSPCKRFLTRGKDLNSPDGNENNTSLGDGQFDRFSATRRTRRYKRNTESSESPELIVAETQSVKNVQSHVEKSTPIVHEDPESRLKAWQERLKVQGDTDTKLSLRRNRNQTGINQDDLKKALHINTTQPIDIVRSEGSTRKTKEDNDEGFEETQSLMSESPSQGASSGGGNYETDLVDSNQELKKIDQKKEVPIRETTSKLNRNKNFERNSMTRQSMQIPTTKKSVIPRRSGSLRKTDSQNSITTTNGSNKRTVQRSSSRNSILSSRSSLNSSTSTNTVKKLPQSNSKTTQQQQSTNNLKSVKLPLRRSSSSSSNIPNKRPPRPGTTTNIGSSSFMKPTASSTTKIINNNNINNISTTNNTSRLHQPSYYRSKN